MIIPKDLFKNIFDIPSFDPGYLFYYQGLSKNNDPPDINNAFFEDWMLEIDNSQPGLKKAKPQKEEPKKCTCPKMDVIWYGCKCGGI